MPSQSGVQPEIARDLHLAQRTGVIQCRVELQAVRKIEGGSNLPLISWAIVRNVFPSPTRSGLKPYPQRGVSDGPFPVAGGAPIRGHLQPVSVSPTSIPKLDREHQ